MNVTKKLAAVAVAAAMVGSLAACDSLGSGGVTKDDATTYIQGLMDSTYLGKYNEDYLELMDMTEEEAKEDYDYNLNAEVEVFYNVFGIEYPDDELNQKVSDLLAEVYSHSKYTVQPATKMENGNFAVEVLIEPIGIMNQVTVDDIDAMQDAPEFMEYLDMDMNALSDEEYQTALEEYDRLYAEGIIELVRSHMNEITYEAEQSIIMQLKLGDDNMYSLVGTDWQNMDYMIIDMYGDYAG